MEFWPYAVVVLALSLFTTRAPSVFFSFLAFMPAGLFVCLMAAAITRRLHDRDKSALWAVPSLAFGALGLAGFAMAPWNRVYGFIPNTDYIVMLFANNWLFLTSSVVLMVLLSRSSTPGPNRYDAATTASSTRPS